MALCCKTGHMADYLCFVFCLAQYLLYLVVYTGDGGIGLAFRLAVFAAAFAGSSFCICSRAFIAAICLCDGSSFGGRILALSASSA